MTEDKKQVDTDAERNDQNVIAETETSPPVVEESVNDIPEAAPGEAAEAVASEYPVTVKRRFSWAAITLTLLIIITMAAVAFLGWFGYQYLQSDQQGSAQLHEQMQSLQAQVQHQTEQLAGVQQSQSQTLAQAQQVNDEAQQRIQALEQRVAAQNKRLLAMSTITREDWLLAEAEYLLKLANQRILIERSAEGAEALLTEADAILRDLEDPDLFPLRKAVNNDLAALRLVQKIDVEGIYLTIEGLTNQLSSLPLQPSRQEFMAETPAEQPEDVDAQSWWAVFKRSFRTFANALGEYVRVRDHSVEAKALLAPDTAQHLLQNLRLILERAQLALLREQPHIYQQSLLQAESYIERYFPDSARSQQYRQQLTNLSQKTIVTQLPDISPSLELLHSYIEQLHQLQGATPATQGAQ